MPKEDISSCINCCRISTPFRFLNPEELTLMNRNRVDINFRRGETLCKHGSFASSVYYIKEGLIKIYAEDTAEPLVISIESRGYFLGLQALSPPHKYPYSAIAFEDTKTCVLDLKIFQKLLHQNALFASGIARHLSIDTRKSFERLATVGVKQLHGRLADLLLCLSVRIYKSREFTTSLTRKDMAEITLMSNESLSRVLKDLKDEKILEVEGKRFHVKDINRLRSISKTG